MLLSSGANVNAVSTIGTTPLHVAASGCQAETVALLLRHGAEPQLRDDQQRTALQQAVMDSIFSGFEGTPTPVFLGFGGNPAPGFAFGWNPAPSFAFGGNPAAGGAFNAFGAFGGNPFDSDAPEPVTNPEAAVRLLLEAWGDSPTIPAADLAAAARAAAGS